MQPPNRYVSLTLPTLSFEATPPEIGKAVYGIISRMTGIEDPYERIKEKCTHQALILYPELKRLIQLSKDGLLTALRVAIAGNVIDFGANADFDLKRDIEKILSQDLAIDHTEDFRQAVQRAHSILYVADNAGETVLDRLLIEELPIPVIYVVREKPVINDATRDDAIAAGIDEVAEIISSGSDAPGTILSLCSKEFLKVYRKSDLIISKGQGNYEGLSEEKRPIYYLLKAKCPVIARDIGVELGSIVLMKSKGE